MSRMMLLSSSSISSSARAAAATATRSRSVAAVAVWQIAIRRQIARATGDDGDDGAEYEFSGGGPDPMEAAADALSPITNWLRSPTDLLTFGPRAALGALLSLPTAQERLASAAERAQELLQDPRPPLERAASAARAAAEEVAGLVEAGAGAEARAISAALEALPPDVTSALPAEFLEAVERASGEARASAGGSGRSSSSGGGVGGSRSYEDGDAPSSPVAAPSDADRAAEEAATLASAAARVAEAADALAAAKRNGGGAQLGMARLNAREARAALARALEQAGSGSATSSSSSSSVSAEVADAAKLLDELDEALLAVSG